jgi:hypothetical protein
MYLFSFLYAHPSHIQALQAAKGVNSRHDDLVDLFESIERFLKPLEIYTQVPPTPTTDDMIIKIMVELLATLALVTKELKEGRSSESCFLGRLALTQCDAERFIKKISGERDTEAALQRLDRLSQDEARRTTAEILRVVYGLVQDMSE